MVIRSAASLQSAPHANWPKGLGFGEEIEGRVDKGWVQLRTGGFALIRHPEQGPLLEEVRPESEIQAKASAGSLAPAAGTGTPVQESAEFHLSVEALQGRWRHSVTKMGLLTVRDHDIVFDMGRSFRLEERPGGQIDMGGWLAQPERSSADKITWAKAGESGELSCTWERVTLTPVLFWGICDVKFDPQLPTDERVRVLELGDGRASKFSHHGSPITDAFESKFCMHPNPIKRSVLVDNKKLTHDMFVHVEAEHLRPPTFTYSRCYTQDLAERLISDLKLADGGAAVLKLCNRTRGAGVVVVTARTANKVLRRLLTPPAGADLLEWLRQEGPRAVAHNMVFSDMLQEHCLHWWSNECPVFVAERCCHSMPVPLEAGSEETFDGTMRVAFALHRDGPPEEGDRDGPFEISWLGGYWKLPQAASNAGGDLDAPEALHDRIVSSFNSAEKRTAPVPAEHLKAVFDALTPVLPRVFDMALIDGERVSLTYRDYPHFRAFAMSRVAATIRTYDVDKSRELFKQAKQVALDAIAKGGQGAKDDLHNQSVLSYVERNLGVCSAMEGNWTEAHQYWEQAIHLCPTNATAIYLDGCYWQVTRNYQRGIECILESIALDPDFRLAYLGLSECHLLNGDFQSAVEACEACLRRFPEAAGAQLNIGQALYKMLQTGHVNLGQELDGGAAQLAARAATALELAKSKAPDQWTQAAEGMLEFCRADEASRKAIPPHEVFVSKVYGWRP